MGKMSEEYISELGKFNDIEIGIKHFFIFVKRKGKGASLEVRTSIRIFFFIVENSDVAY